MAARQPEQEQHRQQEQLPCLSFVFVKYAFNFLRCIFRLSANCQLAAAGAAGADPEPDPVAVPVPLPTPKTHSKIRQRSCNAHITYTQCCGLLVFLLGMRVRTRCKLARGVEQEGGQCVGEKSWLHHVIIYSFHVPLAVKSARLLWLLLLHLSLYLFLPPLFFSLPPAALI